MRNLFTSIRPTPRLSERDALIVVTDGALDLNARLLGLLTETAAAVETAAQLVSSLAADADQQAKAAAALAFVDDLRASIGKGILTQQALRDLLARVTQRG